VDLFFDGKPDLAAIAQAGRAQQLEGAFVRVRWSVLEEERAEIDRDAIKRALTGAAEVQLEGRVVSVARSRAEGISRAASLAEKVRAWARVTSIEPGPLLERLEVLSHLEAGEIAAAVLERRAKSAAMIDGEPLARTAAREPVCHEQAVESF
jgi:exonuclease SbcD